MLLAAAVATALAGCVPIHWFSGDPRSLTLLAGSAGTCVLVEERDWNEPFVSELHRLGLTALQVVASPETPIHPSADALVVETERWTGPSHGKPVIRPRARRAVDVSDELVAVGEGLWPGIRIDDETIAGPTTAPWLDSNFGYLHYLRSQTEKPVWLFSPPPPGRPLTGRRYQTAIADAALAGATWVASFDSGFTRKLLDAEPRALSEWSEIRKLLEFVRSLPPVRRLTPYSTLGVSIGPATGAHVSRGVLDMILSQHIPFRVVPTAAGCDAFFDFADNSIVRFPPSALPRVALSPAELEDLAPVYRRVQVTVGRKNFGLRVFNGSGVLSAPYTLPDRQGVLVLLANFTDFPAENVTLHVRGRWSRATLTCPGCAPQALQLYPVLDATAVEIDSLPAFAAVRVEP